MVFCEVWITKRIQVAVVNLTLHVLTFAFQISTNARRVLLPAVRMLIVRTQKEVILVLVRQGTVEMERSAQV